VHGALQGHVILPAIATCSTQQCYVELIWRALSSLSTVVVAEMKMDIEPTKIEIFGGSLLSSTTPPVNGRIISNR